MEESFDLELEKCFQNMYLEGFSHGEREEEQQKHSFPWIIQRRRINRFKRGKIWISEIVTNELRSQTG